MITDQQLAAGDGLQPLWLFVDKANRVLQAFASSSIVQLVMRLSLRRRVLAFRHPQMERSGKLSDTAVALFIDDFMLHLPGGPYHFPAPRRD